MRWSGITCQLNFVVIQVVRWQLAGLRAVKDVEVLVILSWKLSMNIFQVLRGVLLNTDFLYITLSIQCQLFVYVLH